MAKIEMLRERIERNEYAVDPEAVADAIIRRLQAARRQCS
jgi:anti-sigma28 factor (negative regulator of flagellin synthesis)